MTALEYCEEYMLLGFLREIYLTVFGQNSAIDTIKDWISGESGVLANFEQILNSADGFIQICLGIGILFTILYFTYDFITDKIGPGQEITTELVIKSVIKLLFVIIIITNMVNFTKGLFNVSNAIFVNADSALNASSTGQMAIETMVDEYIVEVGQNCDEVAEIPVVGGFLSGIQPLIELFSKFLMLIAYLVSWVCTALTFFAVYSRQAELILRAIFSPIALSDLYLGGVRSRGFDYLKSFAAICFQSIIIIAVFWITNQITLVILDPDTFLSGVTSLKDITNSKIVLVVVAKLVQTTMIMKSGQLAKEIFGSH